MERLKMPKEAVEAVAREMLKCREFPERWDRLDDIEREILLEDATKVLAVAAPYMRSVILNEAASEAEADELGTAREIIKDLRTRARDAELKPVPFGPVIPAYKENPDGTVEFL